MDPNYFHTWRPPDIYANPKFIFYEICKADDALYYKYGMVFWEKRKSPVLNIMHRGRDTFSLNANLKIHVYPVCFRNRNQKKAGAPHAPDFQSILRIFDPVRMQYIQNGRVLFL